MLELNYKNPFNPMVISRENRISAIKSWIVTRVAYFAGNVFCRVRLWSGYLIRMELNITRKNTNIYNSGRFSVVFETLFLIWAFCRVFIVRMFINLITFCLYRLI